jgi:hypothetical protein
MQKQQLIWNSEPAVEIEIQQSRPTTLNSHFADEPAGHRRNRVVLPKLPRRQSCLTRRAMLAALREAELAEWQATGGDTLRSLQTY